MDIQYGIPDNFEAVDSNKESSEAMDCVCEILNDHDVGSTEAGSHWNEVELGTELSEHGIVDVQTPSDEPCDADKACTISSLQQYPINHPKIALKNLHVSLDSLDHTDSLLDSNHFSS